MTKRKKDKLEKVNKKLLAYKKVVKKAMKSLDAFTKPYNDYHRIGYDVVFLMEDKIDTDIVAGGMWEDMLPQLRKDMEDMIDVIDEQVEENKERMEY